jgi:polyvinyl alcohol dehydrogenase (cytochrome)
MRARDVVWMCVVVLGMGCGDDGASSEPEADAGSDAGSAPPPLVRKYADWTSLGGLASDFHNPGDNSVDLQNVASASLDYKFETGGTVTGTPVGANGVVYITSQDAVYAITAETGELLWKNADWNSYSTPAYGDGVLYVHAATAMGGSYLVALDAETGVEQWQTETYDHPSAAPFSSPKLSDDLVIVGISGLVELQSNMETVAAFKGSVVALQRADGELAWRHATAEDPYSGATVWSSVSIDPEDEVVFVTTGNNYVGEDSGTSDAIIALDLQTGAELWIKQLETGDVWSFADMTGPDNDFGVNPMLYEAEVDGTPTKLVAGGQKSGLFSALNRETGEIVWQKELGPGNQLTGGVLNNGAYDGERIYVACNDPASAANTKLYALDPATGVEIWKKDLDLRVWGPIAVQHGVLFVPRDTRMTAYDPASGDQLFEYVADGTITTAALAYGGRLFFGNGVMWLQTTLGTGMNVLTVR